MVVFDSRSEIFVKMNKLLKDKMLRRSVVKRGLSRFLRFMVIWDKDKVFVYLFLLCRILGIVV